MSKKRTESEPGGSRRPGGVDSVINVKVEDHIQFEAAHRSALDLGASVIVRKGDRRELISRDRLADFQSRGFQLVRSDTSLQN